MQKKEPTRSYVNLVTLFITIDNCNYIRYFLYQKIERSGSALPFNFYLAHVVICIYAPCHEKFFCSEISHFYHCLLSSFSSAKNHYRQFNRSIVICTVTKVLYLINVCAIKVASCAFFVHVSTYVYYTFCNYSFETSFRCSTLMSV